MMMAVRDKNSDGDNNADADMGKDIKCDNIGVHSVKMKSHDGGDGDGQAVLGEDCNGNANMDDDAASANAQVKHKLSVDLDKANDTVDGNLKNADDNLKGSHHGTGKQLAEK